MPKTTTAKKTTKTDQVVALLKRKQGASLGELAKATGWLPHTTRAAMTGLRKKGHTIERIKVDGVSRYAIASAY
jgi:predicted ArsR family transcriptional regulator